MWIYENAFHVWDNIRTNRVNRPNAIIRNLKIRDLINNVENWNGTNWIGAQTLNTARGKLAGSGAVGTAGLAIGGSTNGSTDGNFTEEWYGNGKLTETFTTS